MSPAGLLVFAAGLLGFIGYFRRRFQVRHRLPRGLSQELQLGIDQIASMSGGCVPLPPRAQIGFGVLELVLISKASALVVRC